MEGLLLADTFSEGQASGTSLVEGQELALGCGVVSWVEGGIC